MKTSGLGWQSYEYDMSQKNIEITIDLGQLPERPPKLFLDLVFLDREELVPEAVEIAEAMLNDATSNEKNPAWGMDLATGHQYTNYMPVLELDLDINGCYQAVKKEENIPYLGVEIIEDAGGIDKIVLNSRPI